MPDQQIENVIELVDIELKSFSVLENIDKEDADDLIDSFGQDYRCDTYSNPDGELMYIAMSVGVQAMNDAGEPIEVEGNIHAEFTYHVDGLSSYVRNNGDAVEIEPDLMFVLINTSYATLRGMWAAKVAGTLMQEHIFPVVPLEELMDV